MGWCGRAKPWSLPRFHTFSNHFLFAVLGVSRLVIFLAPRQIHHCMPHSASTTLPPTPPPRLLLLRCRLPRLPLVRRVVAQRLSFALFVALSAATARHPTANAKDVPTSLFTILSRRTAPIWVRSLIIQVPQLGARPLRLFVLIQGSPCRNGCVWYPHRTVKQDPLISLFSSVFYFPVRVSLLIGDGQGYTNIIICIPRRCAHNS